MTSHLACFISQFTRRRARRILPAALGLLVVGCQNSGDRAKVATGTQKAVPAAAISDPARMLAGRWHVNEAGEATKQFTPGKGTYLEGRADGFWPEGGTYSVSEVNAKRRSLHLSVSPLEHVPDDHFQTRSGRVTFTADWKHMTWTRHFGMNIPDQEITYYRVR